MEALAAFFSQWFRYDFMRLAMLAVLLITPLYALLGTMVVDGGMAFFSDSLGHSALTGLALGVLLGFSAPMWAMLVFGVLYALLLSFVKARGASSADTMIGVFSATGMALGIVLLSGSGGFSKFTGYLIGDLLAVTPSELLWFSGVLLVSALYWVFAYNALLMTTVNAAWAASRGVRTRLAETAFACLLAVVVMLSIRLTGILIISAMLVLPAAAARNVARGAASYHGYAALLAVLSGVLGLLLSFAWGTASGATIVLVLSACYAGTLFFRRR